MDKTLFYVHDPMCSWCWGFEPVRQQLFNLLADKIKIRRLVGGLAPDSNAPMPEEMQAYLKQTWQRIQRTIPGTEFNFEFWEKCQPRRSTYPSCRAVIAARIQGQAYDELMSYQIQTAYYLEANNPSDDAILIKCAKALNLDVGRFESDLHSLSVNKTLSAELSLARMMGANSFPSLVVEKNNQWHLIPLDYQNAETMFAKIMLA